VVERISAEPLVVRTRSVIVLSRLVHRPDTLPPPTFSPPLHGATGMSLVPERRLRPCRFRAFWPDQPILRPVIG
jgi:hypothetical protein